MEQEIADKQDADNGNSSREKPENTRESEQVLPIKKTVQHVFSKSRMAQLQQQHLIFSTKECGRFFCRVCNVTLENLNEEKITQHTTGKGHRKNVKTKGTLITMKSITSPSANQVKALETMLDSVIKKHALNPDIDLKIRLQIAQEVTSFLQDTIPDCNVEVFGSSLTCFGFKSSDVNLDLTLPDDKLTAPEAMISIKELLVMNNQCSSVKDEFDLSIPHIFFIHKKSGLACRLCCGCKLACKTSLLLKHYGSLHPVVRSLVVGFRYWAKICSVDSKDGGLSPYCLALMVIQFLQNTSPPILPLLDTKQEPDGKAFQSKNTSPLGLLWFQLFRYYSIVFKIDENIISIRIKQPYDREERKWGHRRFAIEDPYITNHNVSTVTSDKVFEYIIHCLNTSFIYYGTTPVKVTNKGLNSKTSQSSSVDDDDVEVYEEHGSGSESDLSSNKQGDDAIFQMDDVEDGLSNDMNSITITHKEPPLVYHMKQDILSAGKRPEVQCQCCKKDGHVTSNCPDLKKPSFKPLPTLSAKLLELVTRMCAQTRGHVAFAPQEVKFRESVLWNLEDYIQEVFPDARLHLFGSSMNGFGFKESDLDICMTLEGKEKDDVDCISVIKELAKKLKQHRDCNNVVAITTAKVPIVKFYLRSVRKEADISLYNVLALENTKMLAMYAAMDDRVSVLGYTLKLFAKLCDIGDASKGSLSSYAYILMLLHYLQQCNVIPVLQEIHNGAKPDKIIDGWNCWFFDDFSSLHKVWKSNNRDSVGALWIGFLRYYTETFDWEHDVVCCRRIKKLTKFEKMWTRHIFAIEDPFNLDHNLGAGISRKMGTFIKTALIRGRERFGTQPRAPPGMHLMQYYFNPDYLTDGLDAPSDRTCRVCGHIGHIARECSRLRKNRRDDRMDFEERTKLSYRPFAAPNVTPRKRAATAPVESTQNTANNLPVGSLPNTGNTPAVGSLPSTADTPLHVGSLPTNIQPTKPTNDPGQPPGMATRQSPVMTTRQSPVITAWPSSPSTRTRQRSSSESMADSPPVMPLASPPNVYRGSVPVYPYHIGSPPLVGSPITSQHSMGTPHYVTMQAVRSPHHVGSPQHIGSQHHVGSPQHIGSVHRIGSPPSQHLVGSPQHIGSQHHVGSPQHIGSVHRIGSPPSQHLVGSAQHSGSVRLVGSSQHIGSVHRIGSPPSQHLVGSPHQVTVAHPMAALHQPSHPSQHHVGSPLQTFLIGSPPNYNLPLSPHQQQHQQHHYQQQQQQQQQQQHHYQQQQQQQQQQKSTNQLETKQDTADKHLTPDEFFSLVREAESKAVTKPPDLIPHRTISNAVLVHSKSILSSPKTEDEHKLLSNLDKVRSLWSGDDIPTVAAIDTTIVTNKQGLLSDEPPTVPGIGSPATNKQGLLSDETPTVPGKGSPATNKQGLLSDETPTVPGKSSPTTKKDDLLGGETLTVPGIGSPATKKHGLLGDAPVVPSDSTIKHNKPPCAGEENFKLTSYKQEGPQRDRDESGPSKNGPYHTKTKEETEQVRHDGVRPSSKKGPHKINKQVKNGASEEGFKTQPGKDPSRVGGGEQSRTVSRNPPKKGQKEGAGNPSKKGSREEVAVTAQKGTLDEGTKTPGKYRQQAKKSSREEGAWTPPRKGPHEEGTRTSTNKRQPEGGTKTPLKKGPHEDSTVSTPKEGPPGEGAFRKQEGPSVGNPSASTDGSKRRQNKRIKQKPLKLSPDDNDDLPPSSSLSSIETPGTLSTKPNKTNPKQTSEGSKTNDQHTETQKRKSRRSRGRGKGGVSSTKTSNNDNGCQDTSTS